MVPDRVAGNPKMSKLHFTAADVRRVVEHSINAPEQRPVVVDYGEPPDWKPTTKPPEAPAVVLVHDDGIYLMSNGSPRDLISGDQDNGRSFVAYAKGCNPDTDEDFWHHSVDLVGGDDFGETLPWAQQMLDGINDGAKTVTIVLNKNSIRLEMKVPVRKPDLTPLTDALAGVKESISQA